jgi:hypothetical protein
MEGVLGEEKNITFIALTVQGLSSRFGRFKL